MMIRAMTGILAAAVCFSIHAQDAGVRDCRVDASGGAPRFVLNGIPVRSRIFWGAPGSRPLHVDPAGGLVQFEFTPTEDEPGGATMHFRFGPTPGEVILDDIRVVELETNRDVFPIASFEGGQADFDRSWRVWPTGKDNTVAKIGVETGKGREGSAGLHISLAAPPDRHWPDFHLYHVPTLALKRGCRYHVSFWAKAAPARNITVAFYRPGASFTFLGGPGGVFESQIRLAAAAGVDMVSFPVPMPWPKPGQPEDWRSLDARCREVLAANPKAMLLPRIPMEPPLWWREANPNAVMKWDSATPKEHSAVVASPVYRRDAAARLAALVSHLESEFGRSVIGYHPCGQNTGEWFYQGTWRPGLNGYAPDDLTAWRDWLAKRYPNNPDAATAQIPSPESRRAAPAGVFRDPVAERKLIDFAQFQQESMADCVCHFASAVRQSSHGKKLVVFFYGYGFEFAAVSTGPAVSGHYGLRRVLQSPDVDVLCSPISYFDRGPGQSAPAMSAAESVALAGKMWLYEDDTHTFMATGDPPGSRDHVDTLEATNHELVRNTAQCSLRNFGTWWMDLTATGWFNDPAMWAEMRRLEPLDRAMLDQKIPFRPEVAAVLDEASMVRVAAGGNAMSRPCIYEAREPLGRMGAPYGQYLLDDVQAGRVDSKMVVFLAAWRLEPEARQQLLAAVRGKLSVWCYAPGFLQDDGTSLDAMRELTGFRIQRLGKIAPKAVPTELGQREGLQKTLEWGKPIEPLFAAAGAKPDEILAQYADGSAAVALRRTATGWSMFVGPPRLSPELLRLAARRAGVHLYSSVDCNVYANGPFVAVHASQDGSVPLDFGRPGKITDMLTGQPIGDGPKFSWPAKKGQTQVFRVGP